MVFYLRGVTMVSLIKVVTALLPLAVLQSTEAFSPSTQSHASSTSPILTSSRLQHITGTSQSASKSSLRNSSSQSNEDAFTGFANVGFLILAGGTGSRMKANMPKQFLQLRSAPVLHYSLDLFLEKLPSYCKQHNLSPPAHVVLVLDPKYQPEYQHILDKYKHKLAFANPGAERQGSVENGLNKLIQLAGPSCEFIAVHDSARPLVTIPEILAVVSDALAHGAAVLGVPCKATIKETDDGVFVKRTIPRSRLWEVHTPQVVKIEALLRGFEKVARESLEVTDDVSIIEALGEPVKLTRGEYTNLKITTPEDMDVAEAILVERGQGDIRLL
ncbi:hypothetical protein ACHAWX_006297 [Stephanocyclus meneghinianus]